MHYTKYGVNISLLTHFWLLQKVCGTLDHCFIMTHIIHKEGDITNLLLYDILRNKAPRTGPHHIWRICTLCSSSGYEKNTDGSGVWLMILLANACYSDSRVAKHLCKF